MSLDNHLETNDTTIVIGVIGADCHAVGNKILANIMKRLGFNVINLGVMVAQDEYIDAAIEHNADAIFVSSIYGHGEIDCAGLRQRCQQRDLDNMILYVGGNLVIGKQNFADVRDKFLAMGYDRVFTPRDDLTEVAELLTLDIAARPSSTAQPAVA